MMHHVSIRTANIHRAIAFYEILGFQVHEKFTTGYTLACWLEGLDSRIELIQIPEPKPVGDLFNDEHYVGYYHLSFDLTEITANLSNWLDNLEAKFREENDKSSEHILELKVLLKPTQQQIGEHIYEVMFIADSDSLPLEFIRRLR